MSQTVLFVQDPAKHQSSVVLMVDKSRAFVPKPQAGLGNILNGNTHEPTILGEWRDSGSHVAREAANQLFTDMAGTDFPALIRS